MIDNMKPAKDGNGGCFWRRAEAEPKYLGDVPAHIFDADREAMCTLFDTEKQAVEALCVAYNKSQGKPGA